MRKELLELRSSLRSIHNWILLLGAMFGIGVYLPTLFDRAVGVEMSGIPQLLLNLTFIGLAVYQLRHQRNLKTETAIEDQWLGSGLILGGLVIFYAYSPAITPQAFSAMIILIGSVLSDQGWKFLQRHRIAIALLAASLHPNWERVARHIWGIFAHPEALAEFMAWGSSWVLKAIGQPVSLQREFLVLPGGSVEVAPGCDGFGMSLVIIISAVITGLAFQVRSRTMTQLIAIGVVMAVILNIVRIAVMVLAAVYWGKESFDFWHGAIGGQIFSGILFTLYYYAIQPILNLKK
ncbi:cyanoexosortase C [Leptolyngbya sp. AN03gr2]|uniref:cyanoexosortase C n=1 Tax=unclassified Leptolyngbya TaxID=2650499 RepID=UPI003D31B559